MGTPTQVISFRKSSYEHALTARCSGAHTQGRVFPFKKEGVKLQVLTREKEENMVQCTIPEQ